MTVFNQSIFSLTPSRSMELMAKAKQQKAKDPSIIDLAGGEPDFTTPSRICMEAIRWVSEGYTHYTVGPGLPELRERIARKLHDENGCHYEPNGVIVTPGGKYAIYISIRTLINNGDEVMFITPAWVSYPSIIIASGGKPVPVELSYENNYTLSEKLLERYVTDKTKMLIINYPNNPTGRILNVEEFAAIKEFMLKHPNVYLLSDEIYERITYDGKISISPAHDTLISDRVITINGFSKSVAMTGWRIGYLAATSDISIVINKLFQHTISCVSGFVQKASVVALDCVEDIEKMRQQYETRRNYFVSGLNSIPGVHCSMPEGAFYAWASFQINGFSNSEQVGDFILEKAKVVGVPGISYGEKRMPFLRFSFAASENDLAKAVENIRAVCELSH